METYFGKEIKDKTLQNEITTQNEAICVENDFLGKPKQ